MLIREIYPSLIGESLYSGRPAVLVRLSGCNLRCTYCDTVYAYEGGEERSIPEVILRTEETGLSLVLVTGGEPLLQPETPELVRTLLDSGHPVLIETNGSLPTSELDPRAVVILDQKCPGSGMADRMDPANLERLRKSDEVKFVLSDYHDYQFARQRTQSLALWQRCPVTFSPVYGVLPPRTLAGWILSDRLLVRLGIQLHRYLGVR